MSDRETGTRHFSPRSPLSPRRPPPGSACGRGPAAPHSCGGGTNAKGCPTILQENKRFLRPAASGGPQPPLTSPGLSAELAPPGPSSHGPTCPRVSQGHASLRASEFCLSASQKRHRTRLLPQTFQPKLSRLFRGLCRLRTWETVYLPAVTSTWRSPGTLEVACPS